MVDLASDRERALASMAVSRETAERLDRFVSLLLDWNQQTNLIARSTVGQIWTRHVADSMQLLSLAEGRTWVDLGSGAGFPGLVIACALAGRAGHIMHLIEASAKKAAFLREAVHVTKVPALVHRERIEVFAKHAASFDVVTARAVAPLPRLLFYVEPFVEKGAKALLMKGQDVVAELTAASKYWRIEAKLVPSKSDHASHIVAVSGLHRR